MRRKNVNRYDRDGTRWEPLSSVPDGSTVGVSLKDVYVAAWYTLRQVGHVQQP